MNAKFCKNVKDLIVPLNASDKGNLSYPLIADDINVPNNDAILLSAVCKENSKVVVNNLKCQNKHFPGMKTFRKQGAWISEVDTCMAS